MVVAMYFVADTGNDAVKEILAAGGYTAVRTLGSGFSAPQGVAVDGAGNIFIADTGSSTVKELTAMDGYTIATTLGSGFNAPTAVSVDGSGNVYVADTGNSAVKEILAAGGYTTVNTLPSNATAPSNTQANVNGNLYIANAAGNSVFKQAESTPPSLTFAATAVGATSTDSPQTVTVANIGTAALNILVPNTGSNPSIANGFTLGSGTCPVLTTSSSEYSLAEGSSCTYAVRFSPTSGGANTGPLLLTDNNLNAAVPAGATQNILLSGTAQAAQTISFSPPSPVTYGVPPITLAATASSSLAVTFSVVSGPGSITGSTLTITGVGAIVVAANQAGNANYAAAPAVEQSIVVNQAPQTITFTALTSPVAFGSGPVLLAATGGASGNPVTFSVVSGPGSITGSTLTITGVGAIVVAANQAGSTNYAAAAALDKTITVTTAAPFIALASSSASIFAQDPLVLQASVVSAAGTPTGTVTFMDGSTTLGSAMLTGGSATFTAASLSAGSHAITAVYGGDANFAAATSGTLTELVQDFSVNFGSGSNGGAVSVSPGGTATLTFTVGPSGGATFPAPIAFTIDGLPSAATATFSPASLPAGAGSTTVTLTIQVPQTNARLDQPLPSRSREFPGKPMGQVLWGVLLLPFASKLRGAARRMRRALCILVFAAVALAAFAGLTGCGGSSSSTHTYSVIVGANSGALSHSTTVTLTVQ